MPEEQTNVQEQDQGAELNLFGEEVSPEDSNPVVEDGHGTHYVMDEFEDPSLESQEEVVDEPASESVDGEQEPEAELPAWVDPTKPDLPVEEAAVHWKERHANSQKYIEELKGKVEQYGQYSPERLEQLRNVEYLLQQNPQLIDSLYGKETAPQAQPAAESEPVQVPEWYDPMDAYDPTTKSGKWRVQQEQLQQQALLQQVQSTVSEALSQRDQEFERRQLMERRRSDMESLYEKHALDHAERAGFEQFLTNGPGRDLTMEDKYNFYKILTSQQDQQQPVEQQRPGTESLEEKITEVQRARRLPRPGIPGGQAPAELSDQDQFTAGLTRSSKPRWKIG